MKSTNRVLYPVVLFASVAMLILSILFLQNVSKAGGFGGKEYPVYISEIMMDNTMYPNEDGLCCDYIVLYNSASYSINIGGFHLTDGKNSYSFPTDTVIPANEFLKIYCFKGWDSDLYAPFGLSAAGGETVSFTSRKGAVLDSVTTLEIASDSVMLRSGDTWVVRSLLPDDLLALHRSSVRINEILQKNISYPDSSGAILDFIELYNAGETDVSVAGWVLTDDTQTDRYILPDDAVIAAGGYLVVSCSTELTGFSLSEAGRETVLLKESDGSVHDCVQTVAAAADQSYGRLADGSFALLDYATPGYENSEAGLEDWCAANGFISHALYITELMASNRSIIADSFGEFSDWLEIKNLGTEAVNLGGWYLSDEPSVPQKWAFPDITIAPEAELLVFCSGRNTVIHGELHTSFRLSDAGETVTLVGPGGRTADTVTYQAIQKDRSLMIDPLSGSSCETVYATPGYPNDAGGYEHFCSSNVIQDGLAIWEVMVSNDRYLAQDGQAYDWVELRNCSDIPIDLSQWSISDSLNDPERCPLPDKVLQPGEFWVVMLSGSASLSGKYTHADFSLSAAEDTLYLFEDGTLADYVHLIDIPNLESYGRLEGSGGFFYMTPTPLKENKNGSRRISDMPEPSVSGGIYLDTDSLTVSLRSSGTIYYTLDGSTPTQNSTCYSEPIVLNSAAVLRAVSYEDGKRGSPVMTASYLINTEHAIPVVSLAADPALLFGSAGIYKSDWSTKEIEIPASISYYGSDGSFSLDCGISMHGMTSLKVSSKKSFTVRFRNNFSGPLHYDIFEDGEITTYYSILLRSDVENVVSTMMHDNLFGELAGRYSDSLMGMKYKYVALYINGQYWGTYSIREHFSTEYYASHLDTTPETCTMLKGFSLPGDALYEERRFMENHSLSDPDNYAYICTKLDPVSFADWMIFEAYSGNIDVNGNMRYFYSDADGLWRCSICDVDLGMTTGRESRTWSIPLYSLQHGAMMRRLILSSEFRQLLIERLSYWLNGPMSYDSMCKMVDEMSSQLEPELEREAARWSDFKISYWREYVKLIKTHCKYRGQDLVNSLSECGVYLTAEERELYFGDVL